MPVTPVPHHDRPTPRRGVFFAIVTTALGAQPVWILAGFAPSMSAELGFSETFLGITIGVFFGLSTIIGLPVGRAIHRLGWRRSAVVMMTLCALTLFAVGTLSRGAVDLLLLIALGAIANSASQPVGNLAIASSVTFSRQGRAFGLKQAALPLSTLIVGLSVPLFGDGQYWRAAFVVAGVLAALAALAALHPSDIRGVRRVLMRRAELGDEHDQRPRSREARRARPRSVPRILILLAIGAGAGTAVTTAVGGFLVVYGSSVGLTPTDAARLLVVGSVVGIVVRLVVGVVADVMASRHLVLVAVMMAGGAVGLLIVGSATNAIPVLIVGVVLTFGAGWAWNGLFHYAVVRYTPIPPALASSFVWAAMSLGAALGPVMFGLLTTASYTLAWCVAATALSVGALFMTLAHRESVRLSASPSSAGQDDA